MRLDALAAAAAILSSTFLAGAANAASLVADYQFNGNLASSIGGAPALTAVDPQNAAFFAAGVECW